MEEHLLTDHRGFAYNPEPLWLAYHEQSVDQTGELSYAASHHVNVDQGNSSYQQVCRYAQGIDP